MAMGFLGSGRGSMGRQAMKQFATESVFFPLDPKPVELPERSRWVTRIFGWVYQLLLWSILILGMVHTAHQRMPSPEGEGDGARTAASRGLDYLSSLIFR